MYFLNAFVGRSKSTPNVRFVRPFLREVWGIREIDLAMLPGGVWANLMAKMAIVARFALRPRLRSWRICIFRMLLGKKFGH
jgi:hypothetical protein